MAPGGYSIKRVLLGNLGASFHSRQSFNELELKHLEMMHNGKYLKEKRHFFLMNYIQS